MNKWFLPKILPITFILPLRGGVCSWGQTLAVKAMVDFYDIFAQMTKDNIELYSPSDVQPYLTTDISQLLQNNISYRVPFIGHVAGQYGFRSGITSLSNIDATINALTGFFMLVECSGDIKNWTVKEISVKYDRLLQTSWQNSNPTLFMVILETYCSYKRETLGW